MATIAELIQSAQDQLAIALAAGAGSNVDYEIGNKRVDKGQWIDHLMKIIKDLSAHTEADFDWATIGLNISEIGQDLAEYDT